jgi:hypothetical protein
MGFVPGQADERFSAASFKDSMEEQGVVFYIDAC